MTRKFLCAGMNTFPSLVFAVSSCAYRCGCIMWVPSSRFLLPENVRNTGCFLKYEDLHLSVLEEVIEDLDIKVSKKYDYNNLNTHRHDTTLRLFYSLQNEQTAMFDCLHSWAVHVGKVSSLSNLPPLSNMLNLTRRERKISPPASTRSLQHLYEVRYTRTRR